MKKTIFLFGIFSLLFYLGLAMSPEISSQRVEPRIYELHNPEDVGLNSLKLAQIETVVNQGLDAKAFPGCQVVVMKDAKLVYDKAFGKFAYEGFKPVDQNSIYDLASVTKAAATLFAVMKLYDMGELKLTDKASDYLLFLQNTNKEDITISDLLFHESGLPSYLSFYKIAIEKKNVSSVAIPVVKLNSNSIQFKPSIVSKHPSIDFDIQLGDSVFLHNSFKEEAMKMIANAGLSAKSYNYSCINFILLKEIVESIAKEPMNEFLNREFYYPLGLEFIGYFPLRKHKKEEIAPTLRKELFRNDILQGYVNDPAAAFLGGVSGNAGLFSNARNLATLYQVLLNNGELDGKRYLKIETCKLFTETTSATGRRGLGFDKPTPESPNSNPCASTAPKQVYGHTGYTGTCVWVDPINQLIYVFLSNRTYPNDGENKLAKMKIRPRIHEIIYQSLYK